MVIFNCIFLFITVGLSAVSTVFLTFSMLSNEWESISYKLDEVEELAVSMNHVLQWFPNQLGRLDMTGFVPETKMDSGEPEFTKSVVYLVPAYGGVIYLCPNVSDSGITKMKEDGYDVSECISYLSNEKIVSRDAWLDRMRNLALSCGMVCMILLIFSAPLGLLGIFRKQISTVMVTGVMYILAGVFGIFSLVFMHFKRVKPDGYYTSTTLDSNLPKEYMKLRVFNTGWPPSAEWGGLILCFIGSLFWLLLAKIYRYQILTPTETA